ncbi:MAG: spore coat protein GerQ [Bacilli bacterium]|nr:spore coat protein GerQ [Bacilli bacterium]
MNGAFFQNPSFTGDAISNKKKEYNILKDNISKKVKVYTTIKDNEKNPQVFSGMFESYEDNSLILSDPSNGNWYFIPQNIITYIEFEEKINF